MLNGFPLRLVVPGWYGTYWVKALSDITVLPQAFSNFWTDKAYCIPSGPNGTESPKDLAKETVPINRFNVRSSRHQSVSYGAEDVEPTDVERFRAARLPVCLWREKCESSFCA